MSAQAKVAIRNTKNRKNTPADLLRSWVDSVQCMDCVQGMAMLPPDSIDHAVFSPPYDGVRDYNGYSVDLAATGEQLFRVLKPGAVAAMVIQDQTANFGKSLTSFRTIVDWCDRIGFKLFECVIYQKHGSEGAWWKHRFRVDHEYIALFLKGDRPAFFDKEPLKVPSKHGGKIMSGSGNRRTDGGTNGTVRRSINPTKCRGTIWPYLMAGDKNPLKRPHPAVFPDAIPRDTIQCFAPEGGLVLDPFMGCGSTAVASLQLGRHFLGFEISEEYCELARQRLAVDAPSLI